MQRLFSRLGCLYFPLTAFAIIAWIFVAIFFILPPSASTTIYFLVVFGGAFVVTWLFMLPFIAVDRNSKGTNRESLHSGGAWVEWTYSPQEWQAFVAAEQEQLGKNAFSTLLVGILVGCMGTLMTGLIIRTALSIVVAVAISFGLTLLLLHRESSAVHRHRKLRGPVTIRLNGLGIDVEGTYTQIVGFGQVLEEVSIATGDPSILRFVSLIYNGKRPIRSEARIPVPQGHEAEAEALVARFTHSTTALPPTTNLERDSKVLA